MTKFIFDLQRFDDTTTYLFMIEGKLYTGATNGITEGATEITKNDSGYYELTAGEYTVAAGATIELDVPLVVTGAVTLNLKGTSSNKVNIQEASSFTDSNLGALISVASGGNLTINGNSSASYNKITASSVTSVLKSEGTVSTKLATFQNDATDGVGITNSGSLTITSGTIQGKKYGVEVTDSGSLSTTGGTIKTADTTGTASLHLNGENVSVTFGGGYLGNSSYTNTALLIDKAKEVTVSKGTFYGQTSDSSTVSIGNNSNSGATVTISGGTFNGNVTNSTITGGTFKSTTATYTGSTISGGTFSSQLSNVTTYKLTLNGTTTYYTSQDEYNTKLATAYFSSGTGDDIKYYTTLANVNSNVTVGETVKLLKDFTQTSSYIPVAKSWTLDLNGNKLESTSTNKYLFWVKTSDTTFTVTDTSTNKNGSIVTGANQTSAAVIVADSSKFVLANGTISSQSVGVKAQGGSTFEMTGGTITSTNNGVVTTDGSGSTATISGGSITSSEGNGVLNSGGGTLTVSGTAQITGETGVYNNSGTLTMSGGTITGSTNSVINYGTLTMTDGTIATTATTYTSGDNTYGSTGIYNTGTATVSGGTVGSLEKTSMGVYNFSSGTITVSGSAKVLGNHGINSNTGTITVNDNANVEGNNVGIAGTGGVNVTVNGGEVKGTNLAAVQLGENNANYLNKNDSLTMKGGKLSGNSGVNLFNGGESFTMTGGTIETTTFAVSNNGNSWNQDATIKITGGTLTSTGGDAPAIYHAGAGTTTIEGGTITGATGIEVRAGSLNVTGGTITGNGTSYTSTANGGGSTSSGAGIAIAQHTTEKQIQIGIGGDATISGVHAVAIENPQNNDEENLGINIGGGTFYSTKSGESGYSLYTTENRTKVNINGGTFVDLIVNGNASEGETPVDGFVINGGSFNTSQSLPNADDTGGGAGTGIATESVTVTYTDADGNTQTTTLNRITNAAKIGDTYYTSLSAAIEAATAESATDSTIILVNDCTIDASAQALAITKNVTLDLGGHTITSGLATAFNVTGGTFTLQDGSNGGKIVTSSSVATAGSLISVGTDAKFAMTGGTLETAYTAVGLTGAEANITGGTITVTGKSSSKDAVGVALDAASTLTVGGTNSNPTFNVTSTKSSSNVAAIYQSDGTGTGTITITGGDFTVNSETTESNIVKVNAGTLTISGGTFTAGGEAEEVIAISINGTAQATISSGTFNADSTYAEPTTETAIAINGSATATVSGGTITGAINGIENNSSGTSSVTGGTITGTSQYGVYQNGSGKISISKTENGSTTLTGGASAVARKSGTVEFGVGVKYGDDTPAAGDYYETTTNSTITTYTFGKTGLAKTTEDDVSASTTWTYTYGDSTDQTIIGEKATVVFTGNLFDATNYTQATITITDKSVKIANTDGFNLADGATLKVTSPDGYTLDTSVVGTAPFTSAGTYTEADILAKDGDTVKYTGKGSDYDGFVADSGSLTYHSARTDSFTFAADNGTGIAFLDNLNLTGTDLTGAITIGEADNGVKTVTINDTSKLFKAVDNQTADTTIKISESGYKLALGANQSTTVNDTATFSNGTYFDKGAAAAGYTVDSNGVVKFNAAADSIKLSALQSDGTTAATFDTAITSSNISDYFDYSDKKLTIKKDILSNPAEGTTLALDSTATTAGYTLDTSALTNGNTYTSIATFTNGTYTSAGLNGNTAGYSNDNNVVTYHLPSTSITLTLTDSDTTDGTAAFKTITLGENEKLDDYISYDGDTKTITIKKDIIDHLGEGVTISVPTGYKLSLGDAVKSEGTYTEKAKFADNTYTGVGVATKAGLYQADGNTTSATYHNVSDSVAFDSSSGIKFVSDNETVASNINVVDKVVYILPGAIQAATTDGAALKLASGSEYKLALGTGLAAAVGYTSSPSFSGSTWRKAGADTPGYVVDTDSKSLVYHTESTEITFVGKITFADDTTAAANISLGEDGTTVTLNKAALATNQTNSNPTLRISVHKRLSKV